MTKQTNLSRLEDRYVAQSGMVHMTGLQALVRLPIDARRRDRAVGLSTAAFISGYEGSPLGGYDLELLRNRELLESMDVVFRPGVNEELAATAVQGTQLASSRSDKRFEGVTGYWYGKSPGLDRAIDALRHANLGGAHPSGGAVAMVGDDPTAKSSTVPNASEYVLADLGIPTLYPSDPQEVLDLGLHAVTMSRCSGLWSALKVVTNVADGSGTINVDPARFEIQVPDVRVDGGDFSHTVTSKFIGPSLLVLEKSRNVSRLEMARRYGEANSLNRVVGSSYRDQIGIIAPGRTYRDVRQALTRLGIGDDDDLTESPIRMLHLRLLYPADPAQIRHFARNLREILVVEDKRPFIELAVKDALYGTPSAPIVTGKRGPDGRSVITTEGEASVDLIASSIVAILERHGHVPPNPMLPKPSAPIGKVLLPLLERTPYFCSGCPHNSSTQVPEGALVGGGIGCHGLAMIMDPKLVGEVTGICQMGGEGAQWIGMEPFLNRDHLFQNLGDGTFHHSGSLAVRAAVASGVRITYKLLYNSAVAMTGGQQAVGQLDIPALTRSLSAEGVKRIIITTERTNQYRKRTLAKGTEVWHRDRLIEAQEALAALDGVTVLIHDQECATELRRKRKRGLAPDRRQSIAINHRLCEGCGDCGVQSNCLSLQPLGTAFGDKTVIDQSSCNKDYSCIKGDCPSFVLVTPRHGRPGTSVKDPGPVEVPEPRRPVLEGADVHVTRLVGVGGSGVVTASQILAVAAAKAGFDVVALDQTGLAQKGGAVVSDVKVSRQPIHGSNKATTGEVNLYVGADLLVAADPKNLVATDSLTTVAVVSTAEVPTGSMVTNRAAVFPKADDLVQRITSATRTDGARFFNARELARQLFGDDQFANLLLLGAAYQRGALPMPADSIEEAIELNGVKVSQNIAAFRRGRQLVWTPEPDANTAPSDSRPTSRRVVSGTDQLISKLGARPGSPLEQMLRLRVADLISYQSVRYADRYVEYVERVRQLETEHVPGSVRLTEAVATYLYKLMAFKDEYEVARLALDAEVAASVQAEFGDARVEYLLHPPILRYLGVKRKIKCGPWFRPVFQMLRSARIVRGTPFDLFGYTRLRRTERALPVEYQNDMTLLAERYLRPETLDGIVKLASLPDEIRGYEDIKMRNIARYRERRTALWSEIIDREAPMLNGQPA